MKAFLAFCVALALALVAAASAMPVEDAYVTRKPSSRVNPVFFATSPGASLLGSIDRAMRIVELAPSFRSERKGLGYTLEY